MRNWFLTLTLSSAAALVVSQEAPKKAAEPAKAPAAKPAAGAETKAPVKGPRIAVDPPAHDFGKALQNKTLTKEFSLKNVGNEELVIGDLVTSCGCTVAELTTKTLKPGASTSLIVNLETRVVVGKLERTVTLPSNDPEKKLFQVTVTADVAGPAADAKP